MPSRNRWNNSGFQVEIGGDVTSIYIKLCDSTKKLVELWKVYKDFDL